MYVRVRSQPSVLGELGRRLGEKNIDILGVHGTVILSRDRPEPVGELRFAVQLARSSMTLPDVVQMLEGPEFVLEAHAVPDEVSYRGSGRADDRPIVLAGRWWASATQGLLGKYGPPAAEILQEQGRSAGRSELDRLRATDPEITPARTVDAVRSVFQDAGFGSVDIEPLASEGSPPHYRVTLRECSSPSLGSASLELWSFQVGFLRGILEGSWQEGLEVRNPVIGDNSILMDLVASRTEDSLDGGAAVGGSLGSFAPSDALGPRGP